jgi:hypothetical protein
MPHKKGMSSYKGTKTQYNTATKKEVAKKESKKKK